MQRTDSGLVAVFRIMPGSCPGAIADDFTESYLMFPAGGHAFSQVSCKVFHSLPQFGRRDVGNHTFVFPCLIHLHVKTVPLISDQYQTVHLKKGWQTDPGGSGMDTAIARMVYPLRMEQTHLPYQHILFCLYPIVRQRYVR